MASEPSPNSDKDTNQPPEESQPSNSDASEPNSGGEQIPKKPGMQTPPKDEPSIEHKSAYQPLYEVSLDEAAETGASNRSLFARFYLHRAPDADPQKSERRLVDPTLPMEGRIPDAPLLDDAHVAQQAKVLAENQLLLAIDGDHKALIAAAYRMRDAAQLARFESKRSLSGENLSQTSMSSLLENTHVVLQNCKDPAGRAQRAFVAIFLDDTNEHTMGFLDSLCAAKRAFERRRHEFRDHIVFLFLLDSGLLGQNLRAQLERDFNCWQISGGAPQPGTMAYGALSSSVDPSRQSYMSLLFAACYFPGIAVGELAFVMRTLLEGYTELPLGYSEETPEPISSHQNYEQHSATIRKELRLIFERTMKSGSSEALCLTFQSPGLREEGLAILDQHPEFVHRAFTRLWRTKFFLDLDSRYSDSLRWHFFRLASQVASDDPNTHGSSLLMDLTDSAKNEIAATLSFAEANDDVSLGRLLLHTSQKQLRSLTQCLASLARAYTKEPASADVLRKFFNQLVDQDPLLLADYLHELRYMDAKDWIRQLLDRSAMQGNVNVRAHLQKRLLKSAVEDPSRAVNIAEWMHSWLPQKSSDLQPRECYAVAFPFELIAYSLLRYRGNERKPTAVRHSLLPLLQSSDVLTPQVLASWLASPLLSKALFRVLLDRNEELSRALPVFVDESLGHFLASLFYHSANDHEALKCLEEFIPEVGRALELERLNRITLNLCNSASSLLSEASTLPPSSPPEDYGFFIDLQETCTRVSELLDS